MWMITLGTARLISITNLNAVGYTTKQPTPIIKYRSSTEPCTAHYLAIWPTQMKIIKLHWSPCHTWAIK